MHEPLFENNYGDDKHNDDDSMWFFNYHIRLVEKLT
jgi:hypothetical protein